MTNEEAIQFLDNMRGHESGRAIGAEGFFAELCGYHVQALNVAIKALSQQTEDAISRQAAIDALNQSINIHEATDRIGELQSVTPKQITGHWERRYSKPGVYKDLFWYCSECGQSAWCRYTELLHYCPICGAKMEEQS